MVLTRRQAQIIIAQFDSLNVNPQVQNMVATVNYVLILLKGNINPGDPQGLKPYTFYFLVFGSAHQIEETTYLHIF